jgi:hypothetical protein
VTTFALLLGTSGLFESEALVVQHEFAGRLDVGEGMIKEADNDIASGVCIKAFWMLEEFR